MIAKMFWTFFKARHERNENVRKRLKTSKNCRKRAKTLNFEGWTSNFEGRTSNYACTLCMYSVMHVLRDCVTSHASSGIAIHAARHRSVDKIVNKLTPEQVAISYSYPSQSGGKLSALQHAIHSGRKLRTITRIASRTTIQDLFDSLKYCRAAGLR